MFLLTDKDILLHTQKFCVGLNKVQIHQQAMLEQHQT